MLGFDVVGWMGRCRRWGGAVSVEVEKSPCSLVDHDDASDYQRYPDDGVNRKDKAPKERRNRVALKRQGLYELDDRGESPEVDDGI